MTRQLSPSLERLAAVNPVSVDDQLGSTSDAQATLRSIITSAPDAERRRRHRVGGLALAVIALLLASGGAFAATDPFGWWHSSNPQTALYRPSPGLGVPSPTLAAVRCRATGGHVYRCALHLQGRPYTLTDHIDAPPKSNPFSRAAINQSVLNALASRHITPSEAQHVRRDLEHVSDSFLAGLYTPHGYGNYSLPEPDNGPQYVPPPGVPAFLACSGNGATLNCRDLNGDGNAPSGTGIYMAQQTSDWRPSPPARRDPTPPAPHRYTPAQIALLGDILRDFTTSQTSSSSQP